MARHRPGTRLRFACTAFLSVLASLTLATLTASAATFLPEVKQPLPPEVAATLKARAVDGKVYIDDMVFDAEGIQSGFAGTPWTNGVVFYSFDANIGSTNRQRWVDAAHEWERAANVRFVQRTNEPNWIQVHNSTVNNSQVGMIGGQQDMNIANWTYRYIIAHEIGHALGLWHEHQRPNRDSYVSVLAGNIQPGQEHNFDIVSPLTTYGAYDFQSVMHYSGCAFSTDCPPGTSCNCTHPTIQALPAYAQWQTLMGQRDSLSAVDRSGMAARYGPSACGPPVTGAPGNGATCLPTAGTLAWGTISGATSYQLQMIVQGGSWSAPLLNQIVGSNNHAYSGLLPETTYEWRVKSFTATCSDGYFSAPSRFTTAPASPPAIPELVLPAAGATCVPRDGVLRWRAIPGATSYEVLLRSGTNCNGSAVVVADTEYVYTGLFEDRDHVWKVRQAAPCAEFSACRTFTTTGRLPGLVSLSSPQNGSTGVPTAGTLSWSSRAEAIGYRVQIGGACGVGTEHVVSGTTFSYSGLQNETAYFWRVEPINECGESPGYSACWSFTTLPDAPVDRVFFPSGLTFARGESLAVLPVMAENAQDLRRIELAVRLDPQTFEYLGYTLDGTRSAGATSVNVSFSPNETRLQLVYPPNEQCPPPFVTGEGEVIRLLLKVKDGAALGSTVLDLGNAGTRFRNCAGHSINPTRFPGTAAIVAAVTAVEPTPAGELALLVPAPNPAGGSTRIRYRLSSFAGARLTVHDVLGREVARLADGNAAPGWHEATWTLRTSSGGRVAPGIYMVRLFAGGETRTRRLLVIP